MNNSINNSNNVTFGAKLQFKNFEGKFNKKRLQQISQLFEKTTPYKNDVFILNHSKRDSSVMAYLKEGVGVSFADDIVLAKGKFKELLNMSNEEVVKKLSKLLRLTKQENAVDNSVMKLITKDLKLAENSPEEEKILEIAINSIAANRRTTLAKDKFLKDALR